MVLYRHNIWFENRLPVCDRHLKLVMTAGPGQLLSVPLTANQHHRGKIHDFTSGFLKSEGEPRLLNRVKA